MAKLDFFKFTYLPLSRDWLDPGHCRVVVAFFHTQLNTDIIRAHCRVEWKRFTFVFLVLINVYRPFARMQQGWQKRNILVVFIMSESWWLAGIRFINWNQTSTLRDMKELRVTNHDYDGNENAAKRAVWETRTTRANFSYFKLELNGAIAYLARARF